MRTSSFYNYAEMNDGRIGTEKKYLMLCWEHVLKNGKIKEIKNTKIVKVGENVKIKTFG